MNSAGHTVTDGRKSKRLVIAVLASAVRINDAPRSIKELLLIIIIIIIIIVMMMMMMMMMLIIIIIIR